MLLKWNLFPLKIIVGSGILVASFNNRYMYESSVKETKEVKIYENSMFYSNQRKFRKNSR